MIKLLAKLFLLATVISLCSFALFAQTRKVKKQSNGERLITALANSDNLPLIFRIDAGIFAEGSQGISPEVIQILKLRKRAIPLLIRHLDDKRIFKNMVTCCTTDGSNGDGTEKVSVGEGVFNILTSIIRQSSPIYDVKCLKKDRQFEESSDDCMRDKYYWGNNMKRNWLKAYRAGKIHYEKYEY